MSVLAGTDSSDDLQAQEDVGPLRFFIKLDEEGPMVDWNVLIANAFHDSEEAQVEDADDDSIHSPTGSYYDLEDDFIDDSEMFDAESANRIETEMKGFFVQTGDIAVKPKEIVVTQVKPNPSTGKPSMRKQQSSQQRDVPSAPTTYCKSNEVLIGGEVSVPLSEGIQAVDVILKEGGHVLLESLQTGKKPWPSTLESALMNLEDQIRLLKPLERKNVYESIGKLFPQSGSIPKTIKERLKRMYIQWLPKKHDAAIKKVIRRLKLKVRKDVSKFEKALADSDLSAPNITVKKKTEDNAGPKYRCRWELFASDILDLSSLTTEFVAATNAAATKKPKSKAADSLTPTEPLNEDAFRRRYFKQILDAWPIECGVTAQHLNVAFKRYKAKSCPESASKEEVPFVKEQISTPTKMPPSDAPPVRVAVHSPQTNPVNNRVPSTSSVPVRVVVHSPQTNPVNSRVPSTSSVFDSPPPELFSPHLYSTSVTKQKQIAGIEVVSLID